MLTVFHPLQYIPQNFILLLKPLIDLPQQILRLLLVCRLHVVVRGLCSVLLQVLNAEHERQHIEDVQHVELPLLSLLPKCRG